MEWMTGFVNTKGERTNPDFKVFWWNPGCYHITLYDFYLHGEISLLTKNPEYTIRKTNVYEQEFIVEVVDSKGHPVDADFEISYAFKAEEPYEGTFV